MKNPLNTQIRLNAVGAFILSLVGFSLIAAMFLTCLVLSNQEVSTFFGR